jgi:hypothetical protein
MLQTKDILNHIDALVRLACDVNDRAVSEKLRHMADELRIMVSVADIANFAAGLGPKAEHAKHPYTNGSLTIAKRPSRAISEDAAERASRFVQAKYAGLSHVLACPRAGAL